MNEWRDPGTLGPERILTSLTVVNEATASTLHSEQWVEYGI